MADLGSPRWQSRRRRRRGALGAARPRRAPGEARAPARGRDRSVPARLRRPEPRSRRCARHTRASADGEETEDAYRVAGRIAARRGQGKAAFIDLVDAHRQDPGARARATCSARSAFDRLVGLDLGDIVGVDGTAFKTRRGELSLKATGWTLLAKSLRPPPDKFHGLADIETRYRQRELDLIANPEARELFRKRGADDRGDPRVARRARASSRSRRRSCSRSTAAPSRGRSRPTTTRSTATSTCGSRPSSI